MKKYLIRPTTNRPMNLISDRFEIVTDMTTEQMIARAESLWGVVEIEIRDLDTIPLPHSTTTKEIK